MGICKGIPAYISNGTAGVMFEGISQGNLAGTLERISWGIFVELLKEI